MRETVFDDLIMITNNITCNAEIKILEESKFYQNPFMSVLLVFAERLLSKTSAVSFFQSI